MQLAFSRERISHEQLYWFNAKSTVSSRTAYLFFVTSLGFNLSCLHLYHVTHHNLTSPAANLLTPAVARITAQQMAIRAKTPPLRVLLDNIPSLVIRANAPERRQRFQNSTSSNRPGILPGISKFHGKKIFLIKSNISIIGSKLVASAAPPPQYIAPSTDFHGRIFSIRLHRRSDAIATTCIECWQCGPNAKQIAEWETKEHKQFAEAARTPLAEAITVHRLLPPSQTEYEELFFYFLTKSSRPNTSRSNNKVWRIKRKLRLGGCINKRRGGAAR